MGVEVSLWRLVVWSVIGTPTCFQMFTCWVLAESLLFSYWLDWSYNINISFTPQKPTLLPFIPTCTKKDIGNPHQHINHSVPRARKVMPCPSSKDSHLLTAYILIQGYLTCILLEQRNFSLVISFSSFSQECGWFIDGLLINSEMLNK